MSRDMVRPAEFGKDLGLVHEAVVTGRKVGADAGFWAKLAHDEILFGKVVGFVGRNGFEATTSQKQAREIMGRNFFGVEEAVKHFGINPSQEELSALAEVPFTEEVLTAHKGTHILAAVFPMSILDIRGAVERKLFYSHEEDAWYDKEAFAWDKGGAAWHLVRKTVVEDSFSKNWEEQQKLLVESEETPRARIMVYTIIGHYLATGVRLFENHYVRCSDLDSDGLRVRVGYFDRVGLFVFTCWDVTRAGLPRPRLLPPACRQAGKFQK